MQRETVLNAATAACASVGLGTWAVVRRQAGIQYRTVTVEHGDTNVAILSTGRVVKHARYYWLLFSESHLTRQLFGRMLRRDRRSCGNREIDPEPPGTEMCLTKLDGKAAVSGLGDSRCGSPGPVPSGWTQATKR